MEKQLDCANEGVELNDFIFSKSGVNDVMARPSARRNIENSIRRLGYNDVAGADEVGRGALAGPVVAAAVVLEQGQVLNGLRDSKLLSARQRERLYVEITTFANWATAAVSPTEVDQLNVHVASLLAMRRALACLSPQPDFVLVDGFRLPELSVPQRAIVGGDRKCTVIAAASVVAKVTRDRLLMTMHDGEPRYGFDRHKGYATRNHLSALKRYGLTNDHRRSFKPVRDIDVGRMR